MASTVIQMITPVIRELGEDAKNASVAQQFVDWTVDALAEIYDESSDWRFLHGTQSFSTSVGVASYSLGPIVAEVKAVVRNANNLKLPLVTELDLGSRGFDINESGAPTVYMITTWSSANGPTLRLWPVPTSTEQLTVYRSSDPASLGASDTLEVPNAAFHVIRDHVRASFYISADRTDLYDRYRQRYNVGVGNLAKRFSYNKDNRLILQVRDIPRGSGHFRDAQLPGSFPRG